MYIPHIHHSYIVKLEYTGVYIIFLIIAPRDRLCVHELFRTASLTFTHNPCFEQKKEIYLNHRLIN